METWLVESEESESVDAALLLLPLDDTKTFVLGAGACSLKEEVKGMGEESRLAEVVSFSFADFATSPDLPRAETGEDDGVMRCRVLTGDSVVSRTFFSKMVAGLEMRLEVAVGVATGVAEFFVDWPGRVEIGEGDGEARPDPF